MFTKKELIRILIFAFILNLLVLTAYYYPKLTGNVIIINVNVTRVIDGDTLESEIGKIRLKGINAPEKNQLYYDEAKNYLIELEGRQIQLEKKEKDKYGRILGYVYNGNQLINSEILELGLAHLYYYEKDEHYTEMKKAEEKARNAEIGIWKKSDNYGCLELINLNYKENKRCTNEERLILENKCEKIKVVLKDEATHIYNLKLEKGEFVKNFSCIWNDDGDSVYIWDEDGLLLFYRY